MIEMSDIAAAGLSRGNQRRYLRIESWYGEDLVDDDLPAFDAREEVDRGSNVPERITFSVPREVGGVNYAPTTIDAPLGANGQRIRVLIGIGLQGDQVEWVQRGWYVITESEQATDGDSVAVQAAGLLWKIQEARLVNPLQPSGTFISTIRSLVEPALTVDFDTALVDRSVPASVNYDEDRLGALAATLSAWPAEADMTADGILYVRAPVTPVEADKVLDLTTASGGTVIVATGSSTREGVYNAVVAQGAAADGTIVRGVAYDGTGPKRYGGPFNEFAVPYYFDSPLLTTQAQAVKAAATRMANIKRQTGQEYRVEMVPHPALQVGDLISLTTEDLPYTLAVIEYLSLPLNADGGPMGLRVRTFT